MGIRRGDKVEMTIACAMIGRHLSHIDDYLAEKAAIAELAHGLAVAQGLASCEVAVNAADDPVAGDIYLTVTGTSAEAGDDGQVGRGNRINGIITPYRPMSLEAAAGKNPVTHVGKIYNVVARRVAESLAAASDEISTAECLMISRIGAPVTSPALVHIRVATVDGSPPDRFRNLAADITIDHLERIPRLIEQFMAGTIEVF
jgi:S-adenosylmethionine synthetase